MKKIEVSDSKKKGVVQVAKFIPGQESFYALFGSSDSSAGIWSLDIENEKYE